MGKYNYFGGIMRGLKGRNVIIISIISLLILLGVILCVIFIPRASDKDREIYKYGDFEYAVLFWR